MVDRLVHRIYHETSLPYATFRTRAAHMSRAKSPHDIDWNKYYGAAEDHAEAGWNSIYSRIHDFEDIDMSSVLDFACGRGRIAQYCLPFAKELILCDINGDAIEFCKHRFSGVRQSPKLRYVVNTLSTIPLENESVTFLYSWDAMVHFEFDAFRAYMKEFARILRPRGYGLIHHSNFGSFDVRFKTFLRFLLIRFKRSRFFRNPHWRAGIAAKDVHQFCAEHDLLVLNQELMDWGGANDRFFGRMKDLDCITIFQKS